METRQHLLREDGAHRSITSLKSRPPLSIPPGRFYWKWTNRFYLREQNRKLNEFKQEFDAKLREVATLRPP
jgi:hypothetical protein